MSTLLSEGSIKATGKGKLLLHKGKHYLLTEGLGASKVLSLFDVYGELCPLIPKAKTPLHVEVTGSLIYELPDALTDAKNYTLSNHYLSDTKSLFPGHIQKLGASSSHYSTKKPGEEAESPITGSVELESKEVWGFE